MIVSHRVTCCIVLALAGSSLGGPAPAQDAGNAAAADAGATCGRSLSEPVRNKWRMIGGAEGPGCPQSPELATPRSPQGSDAREVKFPDSAILWHASGPHEGQTFWVSGCVYRLYFQYGGPGGWLGLPISDTANLPDGQRQRFEGGQISYKRVDHQCEAEPAPDSPANSDTGSSVPIAATRAPLDQFYDPISGDHIAAASAPSIDRAVSAHYQRLRTEGYVFTEPGPGLIPLKSLWSESRAAHDEVAIPENEREALAGGYEFDGTQGFIFADPHSGSRPLKHFRDSSHNHALLTATAEGEADAAARGYIFDRIEGYIADTP
jgi:uncharacterized protein with LGFP repeats